MRRAPRLLFGVLAAVALLGLALVALDSFSLTPTPFSGPSSLPDASRRAVGVLHVHSNYSDGIGDLASIGAAARRAGLDFFVITDHHHLDALSAEGEGYDRGVLRLIGAELSTEGGHLLALQVPDPAFRFGSNPGEALRDVAELGGFSVVAHPLARRPDFRWGDWSLPGFLGMEIFNLYSDWTQRSWPRMAAAALLYPFSPRRALLPGLRWDSRALETWNRLLAGRNVAAWVGLDAHGRIPLGQDRFIPWPSYQDMFAMARNHLLLRESLDRSFSHDRALVYEALRGGRGYIALDGLADGSRFAFYAERGGEHWEMGGRVPFTGQLPPGLRLVSVVEAPPGARLLIFRDGEVVADSASGKLSLDVERPGVYRAEARLPRRFVPGGRDEPWIVSNPIYILEVGEMWKRAEAEAKFPSPPSAEGLSCEPLGGDHWPVEWRAEHDPASSMDEAAARSSTYSFRMAFRLGRPGEGRPYVWCAVADRRPRDLSAFIALRFEAKADGVYRVDFQLRDANPRASDEGTEWWAAPFKTTAAWREVVIPFARLRSISPSSDGRLDLDRTEGLFFVLDPGNTRPGVSGVVEIRGLQLCREEEAPARSSP